MTALLVVTILVALGSLVAFCLCYAGRTVYATDEFAPRRPPLPTEPEIQLWRTRVDRAQVEVRYANGDIREVWIEGPDDAHVVERYLLWITPINRQVETAD